VDILRRTSDQEIKEHALNVLERNVGAQVQLVNDILDVSRITTGKLRLELQPSDLAMPVAEAIESVLPTATAKGVKLSMVYGQGQARALCDPARVRQVAWNLLSNAIKFTPAGGEVEISLNRAGAHVEIVVRDNGAGIKPDFLPFVFERFRQADSSHTRQHGGLGLGLSIVRHIVETHGGTVRAESQGEGRGATFSVRLPLLPEEAPPEPVEAPETSQPRDALSGVLILVVDDEPDVLELVTFVLEQRGARVRAVDSAASALETLREWRPDIIVCDITMPEMNGHELLTRIRALPGGDLASIPAIVLSANATEPDRRRSLESGFIRHLDKPIRADDLTQAIAETLGL
jgi:CheY-like chemotaxis protein/anti-sigma regulatory factor (Ser/Thr protein kinase)